MIAIRKQLILASRSPRRQILLRQIGLSFHTEESGVEEDVDDTNPPDQTVMVLAERKARAVGARNENAIIVGADTLVVLDHHVLGKPVDQADACRMLALLSGRTHEVYTGFTLLDRPSGTSVSGCERTAVTFRNLDSEEILTYVRAGSPMDKAGAYGIQDDYGAVFVERIEGCFYNVVGFPLARFFVTFQQFQKQLGLC